MLSCFNLPSIRLKMRNTVVSKDSKMGKSGEICGFYILPKNYFHYGNPFIMKMIYLTVKLKKKSKYLQIDCFADGKMPGYQEGFQALAKHTV